MNTWKMIAAEKANLTSKKTLLMAQLLEIKGIGKVKAGKIVEEMGYNNVTGAVWKQVAAQMALQGLMFIGIYAMQKWGKDSYATAALIGVLTGAFMGLAIAIQAGVMSLQSLTDWKAWKSGGWSSAAAIVAYGAALGGVIAIASRTLFKPPEIDATYSASYDPSQDFATGGRVMYPRTSFATGGRTGGTGGTHFPVMVESGETIVSKTQNMARGVDGASGITIQIHGDVYDGDNFAQKIGQALPIALRNVNDIGGM
jgi:hypothetical protein